MASVRRKIPIELLLSLILQLSDCMPVLKPAEDGVFKTVAETSIESAGGVQYFFVNYKRELPQLDKILLQHAVETEVQLETGSYNQFNVFHYAFKHQQTTIIFIIVHHYSQNQNTIDTWEPFVHNGTEKWIDKRRDLILHMYDVSMPWNGYRKPNPKRRCLFSYNILLLEFSSLSSTVNLTSLQLNCPHENPCLEPLQRWEGKDGAISYVTVKQMLKLRRTKLYNVQVALQHFTDDPTNVEGPKGKFAMSNQLRAGVGDESDDAELIQTMPFIDLSIVLNFTILVQTGDGWTNGIRHYDDPCANVIFSKVKQLVTRKYALVSTPSQYYHDLMAYVLIYGAADEVYMPATFASVLGPFPWEVWILASVGSAIAAIYAIRQSEWDDLGATVMAVWAPLLNQSPMNGIARKMLFLHSAWIFVMIYINTCYLAFLASLEMVPQVRTVNGSFNDLEKQNFSFFSTWTDKLELIFDFQAIKIRQEMGMDYAGVNDFSKDVIADYLKLQTLLQDDPLGDMEPAEAKTFLRLESKAWIARDFDGEALKKVGQKFLKCSYNQLTATLLSMPTFVQIEVVYGEIVSRYYSYLTDAGFVSLWKTLYRRSVSIYHEERYLTAFGANGTDSGRSIDVAPVVLHDTLVLESACLYGIGLALAFFVKVVMICYRCWGERIGRIRERHSAKKLTPIA